MSPGNDFNHLVDELIDPRSDKSIVLTQLRSKANENGLLIVELSTLLDLVFEPMVSSMIRNRLLLDCLMPKGDHVIPASVFLRVMGNIGAPEIYYKNGKQHKLKRFSFPTQQRLLQWMIRVLPFFGPESFLIIRRSLPILFGLLSYEFLRLYIVTLIIIATAPQVENFLREHTIEFEKSLKRQTFRSWHLSLVSDLYERFPLDPSLRALLLHISRAELSLSSRQILASRKISQISSGAILYRPDEESLAISRLRNDSGSELSGKILKIHDLLSQVYKQFEHSSKRRKLESNENPKEDILNLQLKGLQVPISHVNSMTALISNFERIKFINPSSIFSRYASPNHRWRCLYTSISLLHADESNQIYKKLSTALLHHVFPELHVLDRHGKDTVDLAGQHCIFSSFRSEIDTYMKNFVDGSNVSLLSLKHQVRFIPYLNLTNSETLLQYLSNLFSHVSILLKSCPGKMLEFLPSFITRLIVLLGMCKTADMNLFYDLIDLVLPRIYTIMENFWSDLSLPCKLSLLMFTSHAILGATQNPAAQVDSSCVIPPPSLWFRLVVSTQPLIVSEALGVIASIKRIHLPSEASLLLAFKNAYVMDTINFVWRDLAFKYEKDTINLGMYLHPFFIQRMCGLDFFSNSSLILTKSVGGIVHNPAFAYICAELVWKLEDLKPDVTMRHPGPVSETTVSRILQDTSLKWLNMSYQELKISLLNHLDAMGFYGLADLLFTSLKPLVNQRASKNG